MKNLHRISFQIAESALLWTQAKYISLKLCQRWINVSLCKYFDKKYVNYQVLFSANNKKGSQRQISSHNQRLVRITWKQKHFGCTNMCTNTDRYTILTITITVYTLCTALEITICYPHIH